MTRDNIKFFGLIFAIIIFGLFFIIFFSGGEKSAPALSRQIFIGMVQGKQAVEKHIDWYELKALGIDVATIYSKLANEKERDDYRKEFFKNLSLGFKMSGGNPQAFINWRVYKVEGEKTIVAADYSGKGRTVLFTLSRGRQKKLTAVEWEELK